MLGNAWLLLTCALLIMATVLNQVTLLMVAVLFFLASGISRLWSRYSLHRLDFQTNLSSNRVFLGESVIYKVTIANRKFLPLPWIHIQEEIPEEVNFLKGKTTPSNKIRRRVLSTFISLGWYHRLTRRYPIQCLKRGLFKFGPATISSGDPFGFFRNNREMDEQERLLVFPRILPLEELGIPSRHPFGDLRLRRHLFEDPVQVMTTRDYSTGVPLKHIHWKATARLHRLQTRVFENTTTMDFALFLDTRTVADTFYWLINPDYLETAIMAAASLASYSFNNGYKLGFYANEYYYFSHNLMRLPPSNHQDQLRAVLEALAQVQGLAAITADKLLDREARQISWEATMVMVTAVPTSDLMASLRRFQKAGRRVALVVIGSAVPAIRGEGILVYRVSPEVYRRKLNELRLVPDQ